MITVQNLSKIFDKRGIAGLHDISFELRQGNILGLLGPNGSGKSTLLKTLANIITPDKGSVELNGETVYFSHQTIDQDIQVQKLLINKVKAKIDLEKKIQLTRDLADTFDFTFQLRQLTSELSSGQLQKVLLASKLINRPQLMMLDEPFTHLDPFTRREILHQLFEYIKRQDITLIWVTHDIEEALKFSDQIMLINYGRIEQFSSPIDYIQSPKDLFVAQFMGYRNFFTVQFKNQFWSTPWGQIDLPKNFEGDGILIIPDRSWNFSESGIKFKITNNYPSLQGIEYELEFGQQKFYIIRPPKEPPIDINSLVSLVPIWDEVLLIPL